MFTKSFEKISKTDASIAGGKGASLGEMTQSGIPVPPGFVILAESFDQFLKETDLDVEVDSILHTVNHQEMHTVEYASEKIQQLILDAKMPEDIAEEISNGFQKLGAEFVAVRSSATAEDSNSAAWAGQLDSFLNTDKKTLLQNVQKCWASLFTPRAIFYRFEQGLHSQKISVAVVVQKMAASEMSGIAFSVHPVTEDRNQLIIEACFGLGEAIVSGQITPDSYVVEKEPRRIIDINVNAPRQVLNDAQILELSELILKIEGHYGFPCDIEWAFEKDKFYITQSRPITTLGALPESNIENVISQEELKGIEEELGKQKMVSYGRRRSDIFHAKAKVLGWTQYLEKEIGAGFKTLVINSLGEQFVDERSDELIEAVRPKEMEDARWYILKMAELNEQLLQRIRLGNDSEYVQVFAELLAYFLIARLILEDLYETVTDEDRKFIDDWRNNSSLFSGVDLLYEIYPPEDTSLKEWSLVSYDKKILFTNKVFRFNTTDFPELKKQEQITGSVACPGIVSGRARVVLTRKERDEVKVGEIIVAPMTTVDFGDAMKKAIAVVTDEGGITCHAAIVSREMKKPCVIGTKIATKVLKTGDIIEVDATNGIIRVVEKAK